MGCDGAQAIANAFWRSWLAIEGVESTDSLLSWVDERNAVTHVDIKSIPLKDCSPWFLDSDTGMIRNESGSFFQISGFRRTVHDLNNGISVVAEQPVLLQGEIGYLGIICQEFDGVMHFLMQAKIEPGNVNKVQVSPTLQATRSNFMQLHGGRAPAFLGDFTNVDSGNVIVDQIQSEQSSRFVGKRNRNVIVLAKSPVDVPPTHRWMTLGQIKQLMRHDNLVNMDSRTVLSCIPWSAWGAPSREIALQCNAGLLSSMFCPVDMHNLNRAYGMINDFRMYDWTSSQLCRIDELVDWLVLPDAIRHKGDYPFEVIFCDISIDSREVRHWKQPLFKAQGAALFGLLTCIRAERREFLVQVKPELGCFDGAELGPTVQREAGAISIPTEVDERFGSLLNRSEGVAIDVMLSEEGGRFFCEQNRNVIIDLEECPPELESDNLPDGYLWLDYHTLALLLSCNNNLNIQLRNLLSLLGVY